VDAIEADPKAFGLKAGASDTSLDFSPGDERVS
jgi:hypothetical protein